MVIGKRDFVFSKRKEERMTFRKISAKEWEKMGLPSSIWMISLGVGVSKKNKIKKTTFVLNLDTPKKKK